MAKEEQQIKPVIVANTSHKDLHDPIPDPPSGHVTVARLDASGKEIGYFVINDMTYNRTYKEDKRFTKKKPVK